MRLPRLSARFVWTHCRAPRIRVCLQAYRKPRENESGFSRCRRRRNAAERLWFEQVWGRGGFTGCGKTRV